MGYHRFLPPWQLDLGEYNCHTATRIRQQQSDVITTSVENSELTKLIFSLSLKGRESVIVSQTNIGTVSKAAHWGNFRETGWSAYGLFRAHKYHLELISLYSLQ